MNIRKLFALLAGVSMVANVVLPGLANAATPDTELGQAYEWAKSKSITTMPTYEAANMYGNITRAELAKMLSNWAMNVKGNTPDESAVCEFSDIDSVKGDLHDFIIKSCQLGLMGQNMPENKFRPYDNISRAEFGTALSRALWGEENNGGTPYYAKHLNALKEAGIMTQISNAESMKEVRGYVMLMLMRSEGNSICEDVVVKVTCAAEAVDGTYKDCPTVCRDNGDNTDTVVKSGDLAVKTVKNEGAKVISSGAVSELDTLTFKATENITLNSITLERYGLSNADSIDAIWLEDEDGNEVTAQKGLSSSKDTVTLTLKKDYKNIGTEASFIVVVRTANANSAELGTNVGFKVIDADSSAKNLDLSNYSANLYDFIDYSGNGVQVEFKGKSGTTTYNYEDGKTYEVAKLRIYATKAAVAVNGFTLTNVGNLDLDNYVDDVEVLVNGTAVKNLKYSLKNDELKVSFDDQEIAINKNETFTVKVSINDDFDKFGNTIKFKLDETTDLNVYEMKNNVRVSVTEKSSGSSVSPAEYAFNGAKISLSNTKLDKTIEAAQGSNDVKVAEGKIAIGGQTLRIEKNTLTLQPSKTADVSSVKLVINGEEYEATAKTSWKVKEKIVIEEDSDVKLLVDVDDNAKTGDTVTFTIGAGNSIFSSTSLAGLVKYDTNGTTVTDMLGSISVSTLKVQEAKGSLINNISKKVEFKTLETTTKTVFDGTFTAKKQDTHLNTVAIAQTAGTLSGTDNVTFHVYIDGEEVATFDGAKEEEFSEIVVKAGESVSVKVDADVYASSVKTNIQYSLQLKGEDDNNNDISTSAVSMVKMDFVADEGVTVSTNNSMKTKDLILTDSDQEVAAFIVKPSNKASSANLDELRFDVSDYVPGATSATNADEYFEVRLGEDKNAEVLDIEFDNSGLLVAEDINKEITGETRVSVIFKKDLTVNTPYDLIVTYANGTLSTPKTFTRLAVDALVRVVSQSGDGTSFTKYTFDIEYSDNIDNETIKTLQFIYTDTGSKVWDNIEEGMTYQTANITEMAKDAVTIKYTDGDDNNYSIDYDDYSDYFKVSTSDYVVRYGNK